MRWTKAALSSVAVGALLSLASGCGGSESGSAIPNNGREPTAEESQDALRNITKKVYRCDGNPDETLGTFELVLWGNKATVTDLSKDAAAPGTGTVDPDYEPEAESYRDGAMYKGFTTIRDSMRASDIGAIELIISKGLKNGEDGKYAYIRYSGGGSRTEGHRCHKKQEAISVDLERKARVSCDLKLLCKDDNPPGETCLSEVFLKQTEEGAATLRLKYLDHFGVRATARNENVGASDTFSRTKTKIKADFSGTKVELEYRAGVTYLAKVKLDDGRTTEGNCSDLAMLD